MKKFYISLEMWFKSILSFKTITILLSSFGVLWLIVEIFSFFIIDTNIINCIKSFWWLFLTVGIISAVFMQKPKLSIIHKLNNRDISIELAIGDFFSYEGAYIIGSNTTFDTKISPQLISEKSIQGQFTKKFYKDKKELDKEIKKCLEKVNCKKLEKNERIGKDKDYLIGTTIRLEPNNHRAYFLAIARINENGVASMTFEDLKQALADLWLFIQKKGLKENLIIPILGTGYGRLTQPREEIIYEIIKSFTAACADSSFCDKLTIVIYPNDILNNKIDFSELDKYLYHVCKYASYNSNISNPIGKSV